MNPLCLLFIVLYLESYCFKGISFSSSPLCFHAPEKMPLKYSCVLPIAIKKDSLHRWF